MKYLAAVGVIASAISAVNAICCLSDDQGWCNDDTYGTPCCAAQTCHLFCCACDGQCRNETGSSLATDPFGSSPAQEEEEEEEAFALADTDGSGNITLTQYLAYMRVSGDDSVNATWAAWFNKHDKNHDGVITPDEITA
ncbi:hypothetical protein PG996_001511 [Apiospora saccharicola]|uniref:EF-hand domain-containing protein n=1 Tax=Apiospora saccharicola TaxID=335842 RepID=A0ABR1WJQ3_9PEZI